MTKKDTQPTLQVFFPQSTTSQQCKHLQIDKTVQVIDITGAEEQVTAITVAEEEVVAITVADTSTTQEKKTSAKRSARPICYGTTEIKPAQPKATQQQYKPLSAWTEIQRIIVSIPQNLDTSEVLLPVPKGKRESHISYCDRCAFKTGNKRYMNIHNTCQYLMLTVVERLKCGQEGCNCLFIHDNSLWDHINQHHGFYNYQCFKCGKLFQLQNQLACHKKQC